MSIILENVLEGKTRVAISGHIRPDGDCVGSCMGLYLYLKEEFPHIHADVYLEEIPEAYRMIEGTDEVKTQIPEGEVYDFFSVWTAEMRSGLVSRSLYLKRRKRRYVSTIISAMRRSLTSNYIVAGRKLNVRACIYAAG